MKNKWFKLISVGALTLSAIILVPASFATVQKPNQQQGMRMERNMKQRGGHMGTITALNGTTITLNAKNGITYTVDASKAQVLVDGKVSSLAFLAVNDEIHVRGTPGTTDKTTITALTIVKGDIAAISHYASAIKIDSINGNTFTFTDMKGVTFTVDATNAKVTVDGKDATLSNLTANDVVLLRGISTGDNTITAHMLSKGKLPDLAKGMGKGQGNRGGGMGRGMGMNGSHSFQNNPSTTTTNQ